MATKNIVPQAGGEGSLGTVLKKWGAAFVDAINIGGTDARVQIDGKEGNRFARALGHLLASGVDPACIVVQGDSTGVTGVGAIRWPYLLAQWLAATFPAYTVTHRAFNSSTQLYDDPTIISMGTEGEAYITLPGTTAHNVSTPDSNALGITGDLEVIAKIAMDDWTPASNMAIASKFGSAGNRGWVLFVGGNGKPFLWHSPDGTTNTQYVCSAAPTIANGETLWLKVTMDVDNGASGFTITFYTSPDGSTWTLLGTPGVHAGTTVNFANNQQLEIGSYSGGQYAFAGKIYRVIVKNGIGGAVVANCSFERANVGIQIFTDIRGLVWTKVNAADVVHGAKELAVLNASVSGAVLTDSTNATRFALQVPVEPQLSFISYSHNDGTNIGTYQALYEGLAGQILTAFPNAGVVCVAQNPRLADNQYHTRRCSLIAQLAAKNNYGLIDVYRAFVQTGNVAYYMLNDAHPNDAGSALWRDEVIRFLAPIAPVIR